MTTYKEHVCYASVATGVLLFGLAGDAGAILFLHLVLGLVFVGF